MTGAASTTSVAGVLRPPPEYRNSASLSAGALAEAGKAMGQFLRRSGFVDFGAPVQANFRSHLSYRSASGGEKLESGVLRQLILFLRGQVARKAAQALQAQAHVRPMAAVKLLK